MTTQTVTALFDRYEEAAEAVRKLEAAGVPHSDISIVANNADNRVSSTTGMPGATTGSGRMAADDAADGAGTGATLGTVLGGGAGLLAGLGLLAIPGLGPVVAAGWLVSTLVGAGVGAAAGGLVGSLTGAGVSEADAHAYAEGVRRGGTLVTVRTDESRLDRVVDILDDHGSVDIDERQSSWKGEGWKAHKDYVPGGTMRSGVGEAARDVGDTVRSAAAGVAAGAANLADKAFGTDRPGYAATDRTTATSKPMGSMGAGSTARGTSTSMDRTGKEAIPIVEESLKVGKREVSGGKVRVHSRVIETPVQEKVSLGDERVSVERRPVDRPLTGAENAFKDRTIEATERREEAVVSKEARVKEELVLNKKAEQRTETVSDKVRHTEVEVEDERGNRVSGTTGKTTDRR